MSEAGELRRAVASDAPAIRALTREAYAKWVPLIGREPKPMTADYAEAVRSHRIDLLHLEGVMAALIETVAEADHLLIENVAVSPAFQGRGFSRKLMAHAEQIAVSSGFGEIRLYTNKLFTQNIELYRKLGYRVDREEVLEIGVAVHMSKPIRAAGGTWSWCFPTSASPISSTWPSPGISAIRRSFTRRRFTSARTG
jgi:ribosomal protein S18 acetylase RimI-like enzyme